VHYTSFASVQFLGGHDLVAGAVYEGRFDVGAGHDGVIDDLANQPGCGDARDVLVRLEAEPSMLRHRRMIPITP
jgi:ABC-type phosphate/phosphonate transport system substrate-binding protein